MEENTKEIM
jgi:hypothetical protein